IAVAAATAAVATAAVATTGALAPGRLLGSAARRTSAWLAELAVSVELLVAGGEAELGAAVGTGQRLVGEGIQRETLLLARPQRAISPLRPLRGAFVVPRQYRVPSWD